MHSENRLEWLKTPYYGCHFHLTKALLFLQWSYQKNPSKSFLNYLDNFLDRNLLIFESNQAIQFIQRVYSPNKNLLNWIINMDLQQFLPSDDSPTLT